MSVQDPSPAARPKRTSSAPIRPPDYAHSPTHHCVAMRDSAGLSAILAGLPPLAHPSRILSAADASREARLAASVCAALDRRDVPGGDTALHLAVRLRLPSLASALAAAGADPTLQNHAGSPRIQEALCLGCKDIAAFLLRAHGELHPPAARRAQRGALFFHDCFEHAPPARAPGPRSGRDIADSVAVSQGCDASVMLMASNGDDESHSGADATLSPDAVEAINKAKAAVEALPGCADILAMASTELGVAHHRFGRGDLRQGRKKRGRA